MTDRVQHQLAAIISGDIVGNSRSIASDEATAARPVIVDGEEVELLVEQHQGHLVDFTDGNFLAYFDSSVAAVRCAIEVQQARKALNRSLPEDRRANFRLGIHQGEVRIEEGRVFGTGVDVAARLEPLADPGGICISGAVRDQLQGCMELHTIDMGTREVKSIERPVAVHRLIFGEGLLVPAAEEEVSSRGPSRPLALAAGVALALIFGGVGSYFVRSGGEQASIDVAARPPGTGDVRTKTLSASSQASTFDARPSIVVLPFLNLSGDAEQEHLADAITEDLATDLSKLPQLLVIARSSAFSDEDTAVDVEQVGRELGVGYALVGSVRKAQGRVSINAQLIDAATGLQLFSEHYDRDLHDIFALQAEISEEVLSALQTDIE